MKRSPDSVALLDAWDSALSQSDIARAPSLLLSLGWFDTPDALANSTIGETDRLLFGLRDELFGSSLDCVATCRSCGETVEFTMNTGDIAPQEATTDAPWISLIDDSLECRLPVNADMHALALAEPRIDSRWLLSRCAVRGGAVVGELSDDECDRALAELAAADPGASIEIAIECSCTHRWVDEFDIRSYLFGELTDWAVRTLRDVHQLASRYGWSEAAILRMSPWRKRIYLDACGAT